MDVQQYLDDIICTADTNDTKSSITTSQCSPRASLYHEVPIPCLDRYIHHSAPPPRPFQPTSARPTQTDSFRERLGGEMLFCPYCANHLTVGAADSGAQQAWYVLVIFVCEVELLASIYGPFGPCRRVLLEEWGASDKSGR
jgi:hypothetical protein